MIDRRTLLASTLALPLAGAAPAPEGLDVRETGARWDGRTDDTDAIMRALAASRVIVLPAGAGRVRSLFIPPGATIRTAGRATVLWQLPGQPHTDPIIDIGASGVTLGALSLRGNIAGDEHEFHHGVRVLAADGDVADVTLADLWGQDLRGDVLYIGQRRGHGARRIRFGNVEGDNILRNVVSIVGGASITGGRIGGRRVGLCVLDIEPETASGPVDGVRIAAVRGGVVQVATAEAANRADAVGIGSLDLDPALQANSSPPYAHYDVSTGLRLHNIGDVRIDSFQAQGFAGRVVAVEPGRSGARGSLTLGRVAWSRSNLRGGLGGTPAYATVAGLSRFSLGGGAVQGLGPERSVLAGDFAAPAACRVEVTGLTADGRLAMDVAGGVFRGCRVTNPQGQAFMRVTRSRVEGGDYRVARLAYSGRDLDIAAATVNGRRQTLRGDG